MALSTDKVRARSQGSAAALTVLLDDEQAASLQSLGYEEWRSGPGKDVELPDNPYVGGTLADAWQEGFDEGMDGRHLR